MTDNSAVKVGDKVHGQSFYGDQIEGTVGSFEYNNGRLTKLYAIDNNGKWFRLSTWVITPVTGPDADINVTMTCCGTCYNTVLDSIGHVCESSAEEIAEFEKVEKLAQRMRDTQKTYSNTDGTVPGNIVNARYQAKTNAWKEFMQGWEKAGLDESLEKLGRFIKWRKSL